MRLPIGTSFMARRGDGFAGALHEKAAPHAGPDGAPVGLGHFLRGQELHRLLPGDRSDGGTVAHQRSKARRPLLAQ